MAGFFKNLLAKFSGKPDIDWDDLEASLIAGDLGPKLSMQIVDDLQKQGRKLAGADIVTVAREHIRRILPPPLPPLLPPSDRPFVILVVGVNGTGKTTSSAKLARLLQKKGRTVVLAAADTFRAAAVEQLTVWSERLGIPLVKGPPNCDPASVCFDAYAAAEKQKANYLICDTAGRLHTKTGLMDELGKIKRVMEKRAAAVDEVLLVLDATIGQNGLTQARVFADVVDITGVVLTKLDGTAKGGIVFRVQQELGVPVKLVGLGEGPDDLAPFEPAAFVDALLG